MENISLIHQKVLFDFAKSDTGLQELLEKASEYADIYLMAKRNQKGCDGMGELAMAKEDFKDSLDDLINYCKRQGYLAADVQYDIDS